MSKKDNKYGDLDEILPEDDLSKPSAPPTRRARPSPSLNATLGNFQSTSVTDKLKQQLKEAQDELEANRIKYEAEKEELISKMAEGQMNDLNSPPIILKMPITQKEVSFKLMSLDPGLIDVSPENERIQEFLDEVSLKDILPSIKKHGQQKPGTVRPTKSGRYELIEGSRRLASVKLAGRKYLALVGDVPDPDVRELGIIENKHQDVSPYEKARAYKRQIDNGEYKNWTQLGASKGISSSHISRYKLCVELDEIFVRILPSPSSMSLSYGETISSLRAKDEKALLDKANELLLKRKKSLTSESEALDAEDIIKILKSSVRSKAVSFKTSAPSLYHAPKTGVSLKCSITNKGAYKFELSGAESSEAQGVLDSLNKAVQVNLKEVILIQKFPWREFLLLT